MGKLLVSVVSICLVSFFSGLSFSCLVVGDGFDSSIAKNYNENGTTFLFKCGVLNPIKTIRDKKKHI